MKKSLLFFTAVILFTVTTAFAREDQPFHSKNFPLSAIHTANVSTNGGSISINGSATGEARVEMYVNPNGGSIKTKTPEEVQRIQQILDENYDIVIREEGGVLTASAKLKEGKKWTRNTGMSISFQLYVKRDTKVQLKTSGGSLQVSELDGPVNGKTSGGSIKLSALKSNEIKLSTSGGSIKAENCSGNLQLATSGGSIQLEALEGTINASTSGGSINMEELKGNISTSTSGGSVKANNVEGTLKTSTSGGSMHLKKISGNLDASTSGGSMSVSMHEVKDYVKLSSHGNISLELPKAKGYMLDIRGRKIETNVKEFNGEYDKEKQMTGTVGQGGAEITVRSSGKVEIDFNY